MRWGSPSRKQCFLQACLVLVVLSILQLQMPGIGSILSGRHGFPPALEHQGIFEAELSHGTNHACNDAGNATTFSGISANLLNRPNKDDEGPFPQIAWLLSFPNSGTTYTMHLIQQYTHTTTATNYGQEQTATMNDTSIPVHVFSSNGPFFRYLDKCVPSKYILTKTHCGGFCDSCQSPKEYMIDTTQRFEEACRTGKRMIHGTKVTSTYDGQHVVAIKRVVHLIRNPFDNTVARLHLRERRWARHPNPKYFNRIHTFNATRDGFRAYCQWMAQREVGLVEILHQRYSNITTTINNNDNATSTASLWLDRLEDLPCFADFVRYTWWHTHAMNMMEKLNLSQHHGQNVQTLFYEDYASDWNRTVQSLLNFLDLQPASGAQAPSFVLGKHYVEYYTKDEIQIARSVVSALSSAASWALLRQYFE